MACLRVMLLVFVSLLMLPFSQAHGWSSILTESGERLESRNSANWKRMSQGGRGYPNPHGLSQTGSQSRPMYCGGNGQGGRTPQHDLISAPDALKRAAEWKLPTKLQKGSNFTLENWITANHGGVAALYYSCPADDVATPEGYKAVDWKLLTPKKNTRPENKLNGVSFSDKMPEWYGWAGGVCDGTYEGGALETCDDCQLQYGGPEITAAWKAQKPPNGAPIAHKPLRINMEYQLPSDFECKNAVFSWIWQTPHICFPKEVHEKGATADFFQKACKKTSLPAYGACSSYWGGEVFNNCIDAEVADFGPGGPTTTTTTTTACSTNCQCVRNDDCFVNSWCSNAAYITWCAQQGATSCPSPYCALVRAVSTTAITNTMVPTTSPTTATMTTSAQTSCETCKGSMACIWTDGRCYLRTPDVLCKATPGTVWCGKISTTTASPTAISTARSTTMQTSTSTIGVPAAAFEPVDGGDGRACRGAGPGDNSVAYYNLEGGVAALKDCKARCLSTAGCKGVEHSANMKRCEVWTKAAGIQASQAVAGFTCLRYTGARVTTTATTTVAGFFQPVDGAESRACRGANPSDNFAAYYMLHNGLASLDDCKAQCMVTAGCKGIEYAANQQRCEVWTRAAGIQASAAVSGFSCYRLAGQQECKAITAAGATEESCKRVCAIIPGVWPCSSDGPCICTNMSFLEETGISQPARNVRLRGRTFGDLSTGASWMQRNVTQGKVEL